MASASDDIFCGPFEVLERVGSGGMGVVHRGRHRRDGTVVALKVMTLEGATDRAYRRAFRREARALAQLHHPSIAQIFDFGTVDERTAGGGPEEFRSGAPWFAMEYVEGGSVAPAASSWRWPDFEEFLLSVLDALAHAHARGVLHRDLSASNLLVESGGGPGSVQVVDFGVARIAESAGEEEGDEETTVRGTPRYMAPEQILGEWRDQGPWTDLYALGCLVWRLVCGEAPFDADTTEEMLRAHFEESPGDFQPNIAVPEGLEDVLRGLVARDPEHRCRRAADAAHALLGLEAPDPAEVAETRPRDTLDGALPTLATMRGVDAATSEEEYAPTIRESSPEPKLSFRDGGFRGSAEADPGREFSPPPVPADWRRKAKPSQWRPLSGAGLELFGLRRLPLVDRDDEREELWRALRRVRRDHEPAAVVLTGPPGSGKTRLADWIVERAHELGAANVVAAEHGATGGEGGGLANALVRYFACQGMEWSGAVERLTNELARRGMEQRAALADAVGLLRLVRVGARDSEEEGAGFSSPAERNAAIGRILRALARPSRPLIVRLDDIPRSRAAVEFVRESLVSRNLADAPVLFVTTARDSEWSETERLRELHRDASADEARLIEVGPLETEDQEQLVREMLHFDPEVVETVVERSEGHPLFAVQLVQSWVDAGALRVEQGRFALDTGEAGELPGDLDRLWARRIDQVLEESPEDEREEVRRGLELAAVLGRRFDSHEWSEACRRAELDVEDGLFRRLAASGLAEEHERGWEFAHSMLAESLRSGAERAGRLAGHHRTVAETLRELYPGDRAETAERRARHLVDGGEEVRALRPLLRSARLRRRERGDPDRATELLEWRRELMDELDVADDDRRRAENLVEIAENAVSRGEPDRAARALRRASPTVESNDWDRLRGKLEVLRGRLANDRGDFEESLERIDAAEEAFRRAGDDRGLARTLRLRGEVARKTLPAHGELEYLEEARDLYEAIGDPYGAMRCRRSIAWTWLESADWNRTASIAEDLVADARDHRERIIEAHGHNILAEIARRTGDWERALRLYRRCRSLWDQAGSRVAYLADVNVALAHAGAGDWERAEEIFRRSEELLPAHGLQTRLVLVELGLAGCAAASGDWERWERRLDGMEERADRHDFRLTDFAWLAERGAEVCLERGAPERARRMYEVAEDLWLDVDRDGEARRVARRVDELGEIASNGGDP